MKKYRIMFGSWGVLGTPKYKYQRVGYVHIKHILGGLLILYLIADIILSISWYLININVNNLN